MFHCFNISKHISISVLFFKISVSCFVFFAGFLKIIVRGGVLARFFCPRGGELALSKNSPGVCPGVWSGSELTATLSKLQAKPSIWKNDRY